MKKRLFVVVLSVTVGLGTHALAGPRNNSMVLGSTQEPPNIADPWDATTDLVVALEINRYLKAPLIRLNEAGNPFPIIATRVPTLQNGDYKVVKNSKGDPIRNSVTYTIRKDAKWSDGRLIRPADFQFWLKVMADPRIPVAARDPWDNAKITVNDADTFTITYEPAFLFAEVESPGVAPAHIMQAAWNEFDSKTKGQKDQKTIEESWRKFISQFTTADNLPKVVAGPFKPVSWKKGNNLVLERNPNFWLKPTGGESKYLKTIQYRFIPNTTTLLVNILSGQLDGTSSTGITYDQAATLEKRNSKKFLIDYVSSSNWEHIDVNMASPRAKELDLDKPKMRQALLYSIDRQAIVNALFQGKQTVSHSFVNPISKLYPKDIKQYPYDLKQAKVLFTELGWKPGADGILTKNGKRLSLNFSTTAGNAIRERMQQIMQMQWKAAGVEIKIQNYPSSVLFGDGFLNKAKEGRWDLILFFWQANPLLVEGRWYTTESIPTEANGYAGDNAAHWSNPTYDRLQKQASQEFDQAARAKLFAQMQTIWTNELPALPLFNRVTPLVKSPNLVNYTFNAYSLYPSWNSHNIGWSTRGAVVDKN